MTRRFLAVIFSILVLIGCTSKPKESNNSAQALPSNPSPVIPTVEVPQSGSRSVTVLRQVLEQEIRDFAQSESPSAPISNPPQVSPKPEPEFRTWADKSGKFSIEAQLVSGDGATVKLKRRDGKTVEVPKAMLSEKDQEYLKSQ